MKKIIFILAAIEATFSLRAQTNIDDVLKAVEQNNTTLQALRQTADAQKLENRTGLTLPDPEVGFNYLWGSPSGVGNRKDASVSQSFDIATVSGLKGKVAREKNELVEWQYKSDRMNILLEAKQYCLDLIYYNALLEASGVSSMIRSTPVAVSSARMLRPSRPMMRPFISSLGSGTTLTVVSLQWSAAQRLTA